MVIERTCANQCSGRGECLSGFCKCADGWYGHDCGQRRADIQKDSGQIAHNIETTLSRRCESLPIQRHCGQKAQVESAVLKYT